MSRLLSEEEYRKTKAFKVKRWYSGERDMYLGNMELKPQTPFKEDVAVQRRRLHDELILHKNIYDAEKNKKLRFFSKFYSAVSALCGVVSAARRA